MYYPLDDTNKRTVNDALLLVSSSTVLQLDDPSGDISTSGEDILMLDLKTTLARLRRPRRDHTPGHIVVDGHIQPDTTTSDPLLVSPRTRADKVAWTQEGDSNSDESLSEEEASIGASA